MTLWNSRRIFWAFEATEREQDPQLRNSLLTVVVGAGPSGVEMAGQIRGLANRTLRGQFKSIDPASARRLIDGAPQVLPSFGGG